MVRGVPPHPTFAAVSYAPSSVERTRRAEDVIVLAWEALASTSVQVAVAPASCRRVHLTSCRHCGARRSLLVRSADMPRARAVVTASFCFTG